MFEKSFNVNLGELLRVYRGVLGFKEGTMRIVNQGDGFFDVENGNGKKYRVVNEGGDFWKCNCPDFQKGHLCKHIIFSILKNNEGEFDTESGYFVKKER